MNLGLYLLSCYLLGAIPTGYLVGKYLRGVDIRKEGSGNMGATNVFRVLGKGPGIFVLLFDVGKGVAAIVATRDFFGIPVGPFLFLGGFCAVLGHNYTCFLNFKGGKGVATSLGVCLGLAPLASSTMLLVFVVTVALTRMVSVGSLLAAASLPPLLWYYKEEPREFMYLALILVAFVWVRHIPNIQRILNGTENKFGKKS